MEQITQAIVLGVKMDTHQNKVEQFVNLMICSANQKDV